MSSFCDFAKWEIFHFHNVYTEVIQLDICTHKTQKFLHFSYFVSTFFSISKSTHFGASIRASEVNATISCTFYCFAEFLHKIEHFDVRVLFSNSFDVRFPPITTSNMHPLKKNWLLYLFCQKIYSTQNLCNPCKMMHFIFQKFHGSNWM